jgi:hypothetical protein
MGVGSDRLVHTRDQSHLPWATTLDYHPKDYKRTTTNEFLMLSNHRAMAIQYVHTTTIRSSMLGRDKNIVATAAGTIQDI